MDHITGVAAAKNELGAPVYLHRDDLFLYEAAVEQGAMFGFKVSPQPTPDVFYDGSAIEFGDYEVNVHHTPGHCPGGVCLRVAGRDSGRHAPVRGRHAVLPGRLAGPTCRAATTSA